MRIIALEYHDVVRADAWSESGFPGSAAATYKVSVTDFAAHLDAVQQVGCPVLRILPENVDDDPDATPVMWTFDDGGAGFSSHAADLLEQHGWRGHVFVTTGCIGKPGFLTANDLRSLHGRGHVIGTHSRNHPPRLSSMPKATISEEWRMSVSDLQDVLGSAVHVGSVPGGYYSRAVAELAAGHGLTTLFTSEPETRVSRVGGCLVVGRFTIRRGDPASYAARLVGKVPFARVAQWCQWNAKKVAKTVAGGAYRQVRERFLGP